MSERDDGGPAFPFTPNEQRQLPDGTWDQNGEPGDPGMSLRDYFAGKALEGLWALGDIRTLQGAAESCYDMADVMLAERKRREDRNDDDHPR